jgi:hypothetical protein
MLLLMTPVKAAADWLDLHMASKHTQQGEFNEVNPGLGYMGRGFAVGFYKNSHKKTSVYLAKYLQTNTKYVNVGIAGGVITGYKKQTGRTIAPIAFPYFTVGTHEVALKIGTIPTKDPVITFSLMVRM